MKANFEIARILAVVIVGLLAIVTLTESRAQTFSFEGYGNPQRPFPGYVGPFQLGPVKISGSGEIQETDGALLKGGVITHTDDLKDQRYPNHKTTWQVVSGKTNRDGELVLLGLDVRVVSSNYPDICPVGTLGTVLIVDGGPQLLQNGQKNQFIATEMPSPPNRAPDAPCRTHNHGMNNMDVTWTDPPRGGPPSGGVWSIVNIGPPAAGVCSGCPQACAIGQCKK